MSELTVGSLSGLAANSYVIDVASGSTLDVTNATGTLPAAQLPAGSILQVVSTTKTDTFSASLAEAAFTEITGLTATITPRSTSSKILAMVNVYGGNGLANRYASFALKLQRGTTDIGLGDADGAKTRVTAHTQDSFDSNGNADTLSFQFLDSPSTTASTTYSVEIGNVIAASTTGTFYVNRSASTADNARTARPASTITLMEVAG